MEDLRSARDRLSRAAGRFIEEGLSYIGKRKEMDDGEDDSSDSAEPSTRRIRRAQDDAAFGEKYARAR